LISIPVAASLVALAFVVYLIFDVMKKDQGSDRMIQISKAIQEGAKAFPENKIGFGTMI